MSKEAKAQERREECRRAARAYLAERSGLTFNIGAITRGLAREGDFSTEEITAALEFLAGRGHVTREPDPDGATPYFKITAEGTLAYERS